MASVGRRLALSSEFAISCGTVTVDINKSKVLLIRQRKTGECMLPKGRKDIGESLENAAKRETYEETGIRVELLPVNIKTLATTPASSNPSNSSNIVTEPIAVSQRVADSTLKIIFWYIATADSAVIPGQRTQQENEDFDAAWINYDEIDNFITFNDDKSIAHEAIAAVRGSRLREKEIE